MGPAFEILNQVITAPGKESNPGRKQVTEPLTRRVLLEDSPGELLSSSTHSTFPLRGEMAVARGKSEARADWPAETNGCSQGIC